jgi:hypothetical protein
LSTPAAQTIFSNLLNSIIYSDTGFAGNFLALRYTESVPQQQWTLFSGHNSIAEIFAV